MLASCMRQFRVAKGRQLGRYTGHAQFANVWLLDCNLWGHKLCRFSTLKVKIKIPSGRAWNGLPEDVTNCTMQY